MVVIVPNSTWSFKLSLAWSTALWLWPMYRVILLSGLLRGSFCNRFAAGLCFSHIVEASQPNCSWLVLEGRCTRPESLLSPQWAPQPQTFFHSYSGQHKSTDLHLDIIARKSFFNLSRSLPIGDADLITRVLPSSTKIRWDFGSRALFFIHRTDGTG